MTGHGGRGGGPARDELRAPGGDGPVRPVARGRDVPHRRLHGQVLAGCHVPDLEHHGAGPVTLGRRGKQRGEPELLAAPGPAVPHHRPERAGRLGHRREHPVPGQRPQRNPRREPHRPAARRRPRQHAQAQPDEHETPGGDPGPEPQPAERAGLTARQHRAGQARDGHQGAAGQLPPGNRACGLRRRPPLDAPAAAGDPLHPRIPQQDAEPGPQPGHGCPAQRRVYPGADDRPDRALQEADGRLGAPPPAPGHPQRAPDRAVIRHPARGAVQLAGPGHHQQGAAAGHAPGEQQRRTRTGAGHPVTRLSLSSPRAGPAPCPCVLGADRP
jgi:hypothetical protein